MINLGYGVKDSDTVTRLLLLRLVIPSEHLAPEVRDGHFLRVGNSFGQGNGNYQKLRKNPLNYIELTSAAVVRGQSLASVGLVQMWTFPFRTETGHGIFTSQTRYFVTEF